VQQLCTFLQATALIQDGTVAQRYQQIIWTVFHDCYGRFANFRHTGFHD